MPPRRRLGIRRSLRVPERCPAMSASASTASRTDGQMKPDSSSPVATLAIPGGMPGAVAADPNGDTVPVQAKNIENKVRDDAVRAMQQGMQRNERADH